MSDTNIAFLGGMGTGKTTCAHYLAENYDFAVTHFSTPLKRLCDGLFPDPDREIYQRVGAAMREIYEDVWLRQYTTALELLDPPCATADDVRYPNEYQALSERGWYFIRLECDDVTRVDRLMSSGRLQFLEQLTHSSETALNDHELFPADFTISTDVDFNTPTGEPKSFDDSTAAKLDRCVKQVLYRV